MHLKWTKVTHFHAPKVDHYYIPVPFYRTLYHYCGNTMNTYKENTQAENLKANARTKKAIDLGKSEADISLAESVHGLVNQVALYRGINRTSAKKILNQILKEVKTK